MTSCRGQFQRGLGAFALVLTGMVVLASPSVAADSTYDFEVVDSSQVYLGTKKHPKTPAQCNADSVWAEIPEYKTIIEEELGTDDPRYHLLLKRATKRFQGALKKLAKRDGYDLIGEIGSVKALGKEKKTIPTVTKDLIDYVTRD